MSGKWGIIVAVGTDTAGCEPSTGEIVRLDSGGQSPLYEHGALVLLALASVWRALGWMPFLYLVTPIGARRFIADPDQGGKMHQNLENTSFISSVNAAKMEHERSRHETNETRLVLVHLDSETRFLHPGLLPWLSRFDPNLIPEKAMVQPIVNLLPVCFDPSIKDKVIIATLDPNDLSDGAFDWLQTPWKDLMNRLSHNESQKIRV